MGQMSENKFECSAKYGIRKQELYNGKVAVAIKFVQQVLIPFDILLFMAGIPFILHTISKFEGDLPIPHMTAILIWVLLMGCTVAYTQMVLYEAGHKPNELMSLIHFEIHGKSGQAVSRKDFREMKRQDIGLYHRLPYAALHEPDVTDAFYICRFMKKGCIRYYAIHGKYETDGMYTEGNLYIRAVYYNNGWIYDPFQMKQFQESDFCRICCAEQLASYSYNEAKMLLGVDIIMKHEVLVAKLYALECMDSMDEANS